LCGEKITFVDSCKYLGHIIRADRKDNSDIRRQYRALCVRSNMLIRRFASCSKEVNTLLFTSYCSNILWCLMEQSFAGRYTSPACVLQQYVQMAYWPNQAV
jgi:hypothetical protein